MTSTALPRFSNLSLESTVIKPSPLQIDFKAYHSVNCPLPLLGSLRTRLQCRPPSYLKYVLAGSVDLPRSRTKWAFPWSPPLGIDCDRDNPMSRVAFWVACHMSVYTELALTDMRVINVESSSRSSRPFDTKSFQRYLMILRRRL